MRILDLGEDVFKGVVAPSCVFIVRKTSAEDDQEVKLLDLSSATNKEKEMILVNSQHDGRWESINQASFLSNTDFELINVRKYSGTYFVPLGQFEHLKCKDAGINYQRVKVGMQEKGKSDLSERLLYEGEREKQGDMMYWKGSDIDRYWIAEKTNRYCRTNYRDFIREGEVVRLADGVYKTTPKILFRQTADRMIATVDYRGVWFGRSIIAMLPLNQSEYRVEYFLGLLNSRYFEWLYHRLVQEKGRVFAQVKLAKVNQFPIRRINFSGLADKARHDQVVALVERMLDLNKRLAAAKISQEKTMIARQIEATDRQIDRLVYELYELTEDEIKIVEEATK